MGSSAREIERQIKETRERMDDNLTELEGQAASGARRYGRIAAIVVGVVAIGGAGFLIYRRMHRPTLKDRLADLSLADLRALAEEVSGRPKASIGEEPAPRPPHPSPSRSTRTTMRSLGL